MIRFRRAGSIIRGSGIVMLVVASTVPVLSQFQFGMPEPRSGEFIEPPRSIKQKLREAESAIEERRWGDAVLLLGEPLARQQGLDSEDPLGGEDFLLDVEGNQRRSKSARRKMEQLLGQMPTQGLQIYRLRFEADAKRLLQEAAATQDWRGLEEVSRRYFLTEAGLEATVLLAAWELARGQPLAATLILERLNEQPSAKSKYGEKLQQMIEQARNLSDAYKRSAGGLVPRISTDGTLISAGNSGRTGPGGGELPIRHPQWKQFLATDPQEAALVDGLRQQRHRGKVLVPAWQPLVAGRYLLARTTERLVGIDRQDGRLIWLYPYGDLEPGFEHEGGALGSLAPDAGASSLEQRVWNDLPYGQVTSDGKRVYLLDGLTNMERSTIGGFAALGGVNLRQGTRLRGGSTCTLVALDLATEGKLLWQINGRDTEIAGLQGAFFLGPPLPLEGRLYVIVEIGGDCYLACLNSENGSLLWRQHLTTAEAGTIASDPLRRMSGAVPSYADGLLVCPTGQGVVVAVDVANRMLKWGVTLPRSRPQNSSGNFNRQSMGEFLLSEDRWLEGAPMMAEGSVLVTPPEVDELHVLDLATGEPVFAKIPRGDWRFVAGIRQGKFFVLGERTMMAFHLKDGSKAWKGPTEFPDGQRLAGRGVFNDQYYVVPLSSGTMASVSLDSGQIGRVTKSDFPVGNLIAHGDTLYSQGAVEVGAAYLKSQRLENTVRARLEVDPKDVWGLVRQGESLVEAGQLKEAVEILRQVRADRPEDEECRLLLVEAILNLVRQDAKNLKALVNELENIADLPSEKIELLQVLAEGSIRNGNYDEGLSRLVELSEMASKSSQRLGGMKTIYVDLQNRQVRLDDWIAARLADILRGSQGKGVSFEPVKALARRTQTQTPQQKVRILRQFGQLSESDDLRVALVSDLLEEENLLAAERYLFEAIRQGVGNEHRWRWLLARVYADAGWRIDGLNELEQGNQLALQAGVSGPTEKDLAGMTEEEVREILLSIQLPVPDAWRKHVHVSRENAEGILSQELRYFKVLSRHGKQYAGFQVGRSAGGDECFLVNPSGQSEPLPMGVMRQGAGPAECVFDGGLLLIFAGNELSAVDLFGLRDRQERVWRVPLGSEMITATKPEALSLGLNEREQLVAGSKLPLARLSLPFGRNAVGVLSGRLVSIDLLDGSETWGLPIEPKAPPTQASGNPRPEPQAQGSGNSPEPQAQASGNSPEPQAQASGNSPEPPARTSSIPLRGESPQGIIPTVVENRVCVLSSKGNATTWVNPFDGTTIETKPFDPAKGILKVNGPRVLWTRSTKEGKEIGIDDLEEGRTLVTRKCVGWDYFDGRWQVMSDGEGQVSIWDLEEARLISEFQVPREKVAKRMIGRLHGDRILVFSHEIDEEITPIGEPIGGPITALSVADGKVLWQATLPGSYGYFADQPTTWPLLIFAREVAKQPETSKKGELLVLDVRTGTIVDEQIGFSKPNSSLPMVTVEGAQVGTVSYARGLLRYEFKDEAPPPKALRQEPAPIKQPARPFDIFSDQ
jgi:outer membrane protein assembly factor BamB